MLNIRYESGIVLDGAHTKHVRDEVLASKAYTLVRKANVKEMITPITDCNCVAPWKYRVCKSM